MATSCGIDDSTPDRQRPAGERTSGAEQSPLALRRSQPSARPSEPAASAAEPDATVPEPEAVVPAPLARHESPASPSADPLGAATLTIESVQREELEVAAELIRAFPGNPDPLGLMGVVYYARGNSTEATKYWKKCLELDPNRADVYDSMGIVAALKSEPEEAVALFREALRRRSKAPGVRVHLARALLLQGKVQEAAAALEEEIEIAPRSERAHRMLGQARLRLKEYDQAERSFLTSIDIRPHREGYFGLATVYARLGRKEESRRQMEKFKEAKDKDVQARIRKVNAFDDLDTVRRSAARTCTDVGDVYRRQGFLRTAEKLWRRAAELNPENTACRVKLVLEYMRQGANGKALQICDILIEIEPDKAFHHLGRGNLCARLKRFDAAELAYRKVVELAPQQSGGYRALAQLLLDAGGKLAEVQALAEEAVRLEPIAINYFVLGRTHARNDNRAGALAASKRAVELDPANPQFRQFYESLAKEE